MVSCLPACPTLHCASACSVPSDESFTLHATLWEEGLGLQPLCARTQASCSGSEPPPPPPLTASSHPPTHPTHTLMQVRITVYEGERARVEHNNELGMFELTGEAAPLDLKC